MTPQLQILNIVKLILMHTSGQIRKLAPKWSFAINVTQINQPMISDVTYAVLAAIECHLILIAQPAGVHYNRDVSSLKPVSEQRTTGIFDGRGFAEHQSKI